MFASTFSLTAHFYISVITCYDLYIIVNVLLMSPRTNNYMYIADIATLHKFTDLLSGLKNFKDLSTTLNLCIIVQTCMLLLKIKSLLKRCVKKCVC